MQRWRKSCIRVRGGSCFVVLRTEIPRLRFALRAALRRGVARAESALAVPRDLPRVVDGVAVAARPGGEGAQVAHDTAAARCAVVAEGVLGRVAGDLAVPRHLPRVVDGVAFAVCPAEGGRL